MSPRIPLCALLLASAALAAGCSASDNANSGMSTNASSTAANPNANANNTNVASAPPASTTTGAGSTAAGSSGTGSGGAATSASNNRPPTFKPSPKFSAEPDIGGDEGDTLPVPNYQNYPPPSGDGGGGGGGAPTPTPTATPRGGDVDAYLNSLPLGEVAFNTPEKMLLSETANVEVKLGKEKLVGQLEELIKEGGKVESHAVKVGNVMEAQLAGAGFEIVPVTPAEQPLSESAPTEWEWQVKARHEGQQRLHLTLAVVVVVDGKERRRKINTFKKDILVEVTSGSRIAAFVYDHLALIVGLLGSTLGGLGIGGLIRRMLRRRRGGQPPSAS